MKLLTWLIVVVTSFLVLGCLETMDQAALPATPNSFLETRSSSNFDPIMPLCSCSGCSVENTPKSDWGWREHPKTHKIDFHEGVDMAAPKGTPVRAIESGVISLIQRNNEYNGNMVVLNYNNQFSIPYLHLSRILVSQGERVQKGQIIGEAGDTGMATGSHVCFRIRVLDPVMKVKYSEYMDPTGRYVNPNIFLKLNTSSVRSNCVNYGSPSTKSGRGGAVE